ncbi:MAG: hypothetical protein JSV99_11600 [Planctomycetota bacterium]|nr:MAG: hypothetical protein JSV99_11600 [Planctomycetota bacterium]
MDAILYIIAGPLFLISVAGYIFVKVRLRPTDPQLDEYYHELEDQHPEYAKYLKWSKLTFTAVIISMLLLLIAVVI